MLTSMTSLHLNHASRSGSLNFAVGSSTATGASRCQRLTPGASGASMTSRPPGSMLAVTVCGSTASGRSNSRLNSRQLVRPGAFSSCRACTTSLRSTVFTVRSPGSNSAPMSTAIRNIYNAVQKNISLYSVSSHVSCFPFSLGCQTLMDNTVFSSYPSRSISILFISNYSIISVTIHICFLLKQALTDFCNICRQLHKHNSKFKYQRNTARKLHSFIFKIYFRRSKINFIRRLHFWPNNSTLRTRCKSTCQ